MKPCTARLLDMQVLEGAEDFAALEDEWQDLYKDSPLVTPFQSWSWLYSWWECYGEGYGLRLVVARHEGLLVGIAPLMLERRQGLGWLLFVGTGVTDYLDVLVRRGWEREVSEAVGVSLGQLGSWQIADLQELRPEAAAWRIFGRWDGPKTWIWQNDCPAIEVSSWDEVLTRLSGNLRKMVRRAVRRAEADGLRREMAGEADAGSAASRCVALHREAWRGRDIDPEHLTGRFESFLASAARRMTARGLGGVSELRRDGETSISTFWVFGRDFVGSHTFGASQEAIRQYQVSSLYIWDGACLALRGSRTYLDLLRGDEPYKLRWKPEVIPNHRLILGRNRLLWLLYAGNRLLRAKARRYAASEHTPPLVRKALDLLRNR